MTKKLDLLKDTLAIAPENYKDNVRIITGLDDKAQKMGTIAGVFLGLFLTLVKPDQISNMLGLIGRTGIWVVTALTLTLLACIGLCLWCMWTKVIPPPLSMGHLKYIAESVAPDQDVGEEDYVKERIAIWQSCIKGQDEVAQSKRNRVFWAQVTLALAMVLIAGLLFYLMHSVHPSPSTISTYPVGDC
jgi:hypothetical protein